MKIGRTGSAVALPALALALFFSSQAAAAPLAAEEVAVAPDAAAGAVEADRGLDEIIVTGEFRNEDQQKAPVAITLVNAETLQLKSLENLRDVTTRVPGLFVAPTALTHSTGSYYIRGVGETDSISNQTVGTYVDDVYIARPIGGTFDLNDVENIQVLRGPQGTLYGRNSSAGAIKITTTAPSNETHYFGEVGAGNYDAFIIRGGVSGALIDDKLSASISYIHRQRDGLVYNVTNNEDVGKINTDYVRAKLNFTPTDRVSFLLTGEYFSDRGDPSPLVNRLQPGGVDPRRNYSEIQISNKTDLYGVSLRALFELSDTSTIKSVTAFRAFKQPGFYDQDGSAALINATYSNHRNENASQEIQYLYEGSRLHLVAGVFALYDNFRSYRTNYNAGAIGSLLPDRTTLQDSEEHTKNLSAYGHATFDLTPSLHLIAGARYTYEKHNFKFTGNNNNGLTGAALRYLPTYYTFQTPYVSWKSFTPKLGISYDLTDRISSYVTYSKGFKAGGFDGRANSRVSAETPFNPEYVKTWEFGFKGEFLNRALRTNIALFHNDITDYQAPGLPDENDVTRRINLGEVVTQGFELEATVAPIRGLTWSHNVSYLDSEVKEAGGAASNTATFVGKRVQNAPKWQYFTALDYELPFNTAGTYRVGGEYFYRSRIFTDGPNTLDRIGEPQNIFNLSASYTTPDETWQFSATVRNVLNDRFEQGGQRGNGITAINATTFNEPRLWYLRARYKY